MTSLSSFGVEKDSRPASGTSETFPPQVVSGHNELLKTAGGRELIDMFSAHGTAILGHANPALTSYLAPQAEGLWISGGLETPVHLEAKQRIESYFPDSHQVRMIYSTGMESAEFAIRIARGVTKANGAIGFERAMHGKSMATAYLGWDNKDNLQLPDFYRLPFVNTCPEEEVLNQVRKTLTERPISAVFIEPFQGTGGGHEGSVAFYQELFAVCNEHNVLMVMDEILTGFFRTGTPFYHSRLEIVPDIVLIGKAMGNGFPVSAVVANKKYTIEGRMLPGSTYSGNPLASAAIVATLREIEKLDMGSMTGRIGETIGRLVAPIREAGAALRGRGALWVIELPSHVNGKQVVTNIFHRGVFLFSAGSFIRLMPAATIAEDRLARACTVIAEEVIKACRNEG